jgi:hypothetical protein
VRPPPSRTRTGPASPRRPVCAPRVMALIIVPQIAPVGARSPDPAPWPDRRSPNNQETCGRARSALWKEALVLHPARFMERRCSTSSTVSAGKAEQPRTSCAPKEPALASLVHTRRFSPVTIGFWLGGAGMGIGGCLLGALMPYRHPVAVALSVLWWGIYFGCFGASIGALVGVFADPAPTWPSQASAGAGTAPTESEQTDGIPGRGQAGSGHR